MPESARGAMRCCHEHAVQTPALPSRSRAAAACRSHYDALPEVCFRPLARALTSSGRGYDEDLDESVFDHPRWPVVDDWLKYGDDGPVQLRTEAFAPSADSSRTTGNDT
ncbi:hypothetical protein DN051_40420 [Streptomyces cadmiisoli]|uniref:Uncharacterized protein n=1 Tax=Streptomyces cadmiisoli TaxID=2184053 RepID=A0A2Z4IRR6_9ACTN|nr:hypothetical protein DN051_00390 [Streptomyces cadmiisoli]AWW42091.1 hypothetical protein DN051_40420 [Streptomyces cadmiisoli]